MTYSLPENKEASRLKFRDPNYKPQLQFADVSTLSDNATFPFPFFKVQPGK